MVIGGEPLDEGGWGECTMPASTEPPMVIGGEASIWRCVSARYSALQRSRRW